MLDTSRFHHARVFGVLAVFFAAILFSAPEASAGSGLPTKVKEKHVMWATGQGYPPSPQQLANNLI